MRKLIIAVAVISALAVPAIAVANIDRGEAKVITSQEAQKLAAIGHPWQFAGVTLNMVGPQGGSIEWVGHFTLFRYGPSFQTCTGYVEIGPAGGIHNTHIGCVDDPNQG
jgi:hypothetical protein